MVTPSRNILVSGLGAPAHLVEGVEMGWSGVGQELAGYTARFNFFPFWVGRGKKKGGGAQVFFRLRIFPFLFCFKQTGRTNKSEKEKKESRTSLNGGIFLMASALFSSSEWGLRPCLFSLALTLARPTDKKSQSLGPTNFLCGKGSAGR